jgi:hypothetical protein
MGRSLDYFGRSRATCLEDRVTPGDWCVEREDEDGGVEGAIFSGPNARQRDLLY